jgi:2-oxoglutarate dehydrogenase complex dehydrogenase (E1) component-like enzyme
LHLACVRRFHACCSRSVPELDQQRFNSDFHVQNEVHARSLCALSTEQTMPVNKQDWIEQLDRIYCRTMSLECEHIEVS